MSYEFFIAGVQHHEYKKCINKLEEGMELGLVPEPNNPYDSNAIKIVTSELDNEFMLGYVPKKISAEVSAFLILAADPTCFITEVNPSAKTWEMIKVSIEDRGEEIDEDEGPDADDLPL